MNSDQLQPNPSDQAFSIQYSSPLYHAKQFVRKNLVATLSISVVTSLIVAAGSGVSIWNSSRSLEQISKRERQLQKNTGDITYLDEVLTMSARMAASTGDLAWLQRYEKHVPLLDQAIAQTLKDVTEDIRADASKTDAANKRLIELEEQAFELVKANKAEDAQKLLAGEEYELLKAQYAEGNRQVTKRIEIYINKQLETYQDQLKNSISFAGLVAFPILLAGWLLVLLAVRDYVRDKQATQDKINQSQLDQLVLNSQLQEEIDTRKRQEEETRQDNDQLQGDIIELLDVVANVEEGDFTTQATVNDRATGLIADTLNRLIEELGNILKQVSATSRQVSASSIRQKDISEIVARNTDQQSQEVMQVLGLINDVRSFATNAAQQLATTNQSLVTLNTAVAQGQVEIGSLGEEIDVLQQGSDRIVQQMKTLGEFVGLTDQFVQDQGDIAEQTQMLALNAALVAARASEQSDPKRFAQVAQEFESIANQVSQLAQQTNDGLGSLEQRSAQIHRVVADVDADVQRLGGVVDDFTQGVRHTQSVFQEVQDVTGQAVASGEAVAKTSEDIVHTSEQTAMTMEAIAQLSTQIATQSDDAQQLADTMNQLSDDLLGKVTVFTLPEEEDFTLLQTTPSRQPQAFTADAQSTELSPLTEAEDVIADALSEEVTPIAESEDFAPALEYEELAPIAESEDFTSEAQFEELTSALESEEVTTAEQFEEFIPTEASEDFTSALASEDSESVVQTEALEEVEASMPAAESEALFPAMEFEDLTPTEESTASVPGEQAEDLTLLMDSASVMPTAEFEESMPPEPSDEFTLAETSEALTSNSDSKEAIAAESSDELISAGESEELSPAEDPEVSPLVEHSEDAVAVDDSEGSPSSESALAV